MHVLHVIGSLAAVYGGPSKAVVEMATAIRRRGARVTVFATDVGGPTVWMGEARTAGVEVTIFPTNALPALAYSRDMATAMRAMVPTVDVVHLHSLYRYHTWLTGKLCQQHGVPYILRPHGMLDPYIRQRWRGPKLILNWLFQEDILRRAAAIHYTTMEEQKLAEQVVNGVRGAVVALGIETTEFASLPDPQQFRDRYPEVGNRPIVLFLSRLHEKKGLNLLIPAFAEAAQDVDVHLVLAGPDFGMRSQIEDWIANYSLENRVTLPGMLRGDEKLAAFAAADLFVLPSYSENFGIAVAEAMAAGLPVVISDRVNIWREVQSDGAGAVVPCEVAALRTALSDLLRNKDARRRMGDAARCCAYERYSWDQIAADLEALYQSVIK